MTEPINERCWEYYGFPNPEFMEPRLPWLGLLRALAERYKIAFGGISDEVIFENDYLGNLFGGYDVPAILNYYQSPYDVNPGWGYSYITVLERVCHRYLNPAKLTGVENITNISELMWTYNDLKDAAAEILQEDIITQSERLAPIWPLKWLKQQYTMINLLRISSVQFQVSRYYGNNYIAIDPTFEEAFNIAKLNLHPYSQSAQWWVEVFGKCYNENSYWASIGAVRECSVDLQESYPTGDSWLIANFTGIENNLESFGLNYDVIKYGWNVFEADESGVFLYYDPYRIQASDVQTPTPEKDTHIGWMPSMAYAFHDYTSSFYFKEEEPDT